MDLSSGRVGKRMVSPVGVKVTWLGCVGKSDGNTVGKDPCEPWQVVPRAALAAGKICD